MASVFRRKRRVRLANGKTVVRQSCKWHIKYTDADGIERRVIGCTDKGATAQLAASLEKEAALAKAGVVDRYKKHRQRPLNEHVEDFRQALLAKQNKPGYVETVCTRVARVFHECGFLFWQDIQASRVQRAISGLRNRVKVVERQQLNGKKDKAVQWKDLGPISAQTHNFYLQSVRQFCTWMVQDGRAGESPVAHLRGVNVRTDRRHDRRSLEPDEIRRLLEAAQAGPDRFGMTGQERALLYRLAVETGLRRDELKSLKRSSFDFDDCTVTVEPGYTKNKKLAVLPLRKDTAALMRESLSDRLPGAPAFNVPAKAANMLRKDLEAAGISYVDEAGRYADFHALRHSTGSLLAASGAHPKVVQSLMRHSDINLTMSRYTHIFRGQESEAVEGLPDLSAPSTKAQKAAATGTDDAGGIVGRPRSRALTPHLTPQLTPTAYPACNRLSFDGTETGVLHGMPDVAEIGVFEPAGRENKGKGNTSRDVRILGPTKPTVGFEPTTPGLQNQSSTVELRWRVSGPAEAPFRPDGARRITSATPDFKQI